MASTISELEEEISLAATQDEFGLWDVRDLVELWDPTLSQPEVKEITLSVIQKLLQEDKLVTGIPAANFFRAWRAGPVDIISYIRESWNAMEPKRISLGDICWFISPAAGVDIVWSDLPA